MVQNKNDLEKIYSKKDPWGFKNNEFDLERKKIILEKSSYFCNTILNRKRYFNALELGAGEGWITEDLPAENLYGHELSDLAKSRWSKKIKHFDKNNKYDLIIAPGVLYKQYDYADFLNIIDTCANGIVITINIKSWEVNEIKNRKNQIYESEFPYRQYVEKLRVLDFSQRK